MEPAHPSLQQVLQSLPTLVQGEKEAGVVLAALLLLLCAPKGTGGVEVRTDVGVGLGIVAVEVCMPFDAILLETTVVAKLRLIIGAPLVDEVI